LEDRGSVGASRRNGSKGPILDVYDDDESKKLERKRETEKKNIFLPYDSSLFLTSSYRMVDNLNQPIFYKTLCCRNFTQ